MTLQLNAPKIPWRARSIRLLLSSLVLVPAVTISRTKKPTLPSASDPLDGQLIRFSAMLTDRDITASERFYTRSVVFRVTEGMEGMRFLEGKGVTAPLQGRWSCEGVFPSTGKHIASEIVLSSTLDGAWLLVRHDDLPPNVFHSSEYWGFDSRQKEFVAFVFDNFGGARKFTSSGWAADKLKWSGETSTAKPPTVERFVYTQDGPDRLIVNWEGKKGFADWRVGDTLTCKR